MRTPSRPDECVSRPSAYLPGSRARLVIVPGGDQLGAARREGWVAIFGDLEAQQLRADGQHADDRRPPYQVEVA
jgi:hypothetical protein